MKLPKIFIPEKSLEEKTKQLMEKPLNKPQDRSERHGQLYEELKTEFPEFTDYLFSLYSNLGIFETKDKKGAAVWKFYITHPKKTSPFLVSEIERYIKQCGKDISEYGYRIKVLIEGNWHFLKYRSGYYCFDSPSAMISTKNPLRYDKEKGIPFP